MVLNSYLAYIDLIFLQELPIVKMPGAFRPIRNILHLHNNFNFTELIFETVGKSLRHSCRTEITRQGILLP